MQLEPAIKDARLLAMDFESVAVETCKSFLYCGCFGRWRVWDVNDVLDVHHLRYLLIVEGDGKGSRKLSIIRSHTGDPGAVEVRGTMMGVML